MLKLVKLIWLVKLMEKNMLQQPFDHIHVYMYVCMYVCIYEEFICKNR